MRVRWGEGGAFSVVPAWVLHAKLDGKLISDRAVRLFAVLAGQAYEPETASTNSHDELAAALGCANSTARVALAELVAVGAVSVVQPNVEGGVQVGPWVPNEYIIHATPRLPVSRQSPADVPAVPIAGVPADHARAVSPESLEQEEAVSSTQRRVAAPSADQLGLEGMPDPVPKPPRAPRLDPLRDVFLEAFGACRNESEHGRRNRACFLVRQALSHGGAALPADGGAAELRRRIGVAQAEWGKRGIYVTDIGVANQWSLLGRMLTEGSGRLTAEQIFQQAVDEGLQL